MINKQAPFSPDAIYHVFNRANGKDKLFVSQDNYRYFLNRYRQYIYPIADTFCYCLMPNHFHFLVKIKSESALSSNLSGFGNLTGLNESERFISQQWSNFLNAYTKAFNKQQQRRGNLFMRPTKRIRVNDEKHLRKLVHYIHWNPVAAGLAGNSSQWPFSSYNAIISNKPTSIVKADVIALFDSVDNFIYCHSTEPKLSGIEEFWDYP